MAILVDPGTSFTTLPPSDLAAPVPVATSPAHLGAPPLPGATTTGHPSAPSPAWSMFDIEPLPAPYPRVAVPYGQRTGPWAIAHRGGLANAPENTVAAFARATDAGLTYLETDVRVTADGVPVAFHDATLDRVTDLVGPVGARTWVELATARVLGAEPITRIDDLLARFPDSRFIVDVKEAAAIGPLVDAVRRTRAADRVCVAGGFDGWLAEIRDRTGVASALGWRALLRLYLCAMSGVRPPREIAAGGDFAHAAWRLGRLALMANPRVADRLVGMAHDLRLRVVAWTVDAPDDVRRLLDQGVDGIIADDAETLVGTFASVGRAPAGP
ncbi:glycerophosphodiester phosphodiesterase family protein [Georgenia sp. Z1491]|uniref:glycerophosphodiester phosphodiesterase family protein n=1 Tax=Georgenia sp. Z1491 TaxID=3416707 RepID=UPI003CF85563